MQVTAYLHFNGQCEAAFQFYAKLLGGKIETIIPHSTAPAALHIPEEWRGKVMHAAMQIPGGSLFGSDVPPDVYQKPQGFSMSITLTDPVEAERIFHGLAEGGSVKMPIQQTFWSQKFGMLVDRFNIPWMINTMPPQQG